MSIQQEQEYQIVELRDIGETVVMRDYAPEDSEKILAFFDELSLTPEGQRAIRFRFDRQISRERFDAYVIKNPAVKHATLVTSPDNGKILGLGQYTVVDDDPKRAELTRLISPNIQGLGVGTELVGRLIKNVKY